MRLILAESADGFLAKPGADDMSWTGPTDKKLFKLFTLAGPGSVLLTSAITVQCMPQLWRRSLALVSRQTFPLRLAQATYPDAWLIGGPTLALAAVQEGLCTQVVLCTNRAQLGAGISSAPLRGALGTPDMECRIEDVRVQLWLRSHNPLGS